MIANCLKNVPCNPVMKAVGRNTPMSTSEIAIKALPTSSIVLWAASLETCPARDIAFDVLNDDDGVVDDDTDGQNQPK